VVFIHGEERAGLRLESGTADELVFRRGEERLALPATAVSEIFLDSGAAPPGSTARTANLYATNGDRLHGTVTGEGDAVRLDGKGVTGYRVPLADVRAVRFGRLMAGVQQTYEELFVAELDRNRDVLIIQRDTRPFPVTGRVLSVGSSSVRVLLGESEREIEADRIYAFVRQTAPADPPAGDRILVRASLLDGGTATLPLERVDGTAVEGGGVRIERGAARVLTLLGGHVALLSTLDPIDFEGVVAIGAAPKWRRDAMVFGGPLRLDGRDYDHGVGVQASSRLEYVLGARWKRFFVRCGIDDQAGPRGEAIFRVTGDGVVLAEVTHRRGEPVRELLVDIEGVDRLALEALPGDDDLSDLCDWAEARVFAVDPPELPPAAGTE
jgi:hypothetical protein